MSEADDRLRTLLRADPPASVTALDETARTALADLIDGARKHQSASLGESFEATLKHVPFPARKIVKKVLLG